MKRILYVAVISFCVGAHYFVAVEQMRRDEKSLELPAFTAVEHKSTAPVYVNPVVDASDEQVKNALLPLLDSESIEKAAMLLKGVSATRAREITNLVLSDKDFTLSQQNQRLFVAAVADLFKDKPECQTIFLEILLKQPSLTQGEPIIYTWINHEYEKAVPWLLRALKTWQKNKKIELPVELCELIRRTYSFVVDINDAHVLGHLVEKQVPCSPQLASELLLRAASLPKSDPLFVQVLVEKGADVSYAQEGYTSLMKATQQNNLSFVKELLDRGAVVDTMLDPKIGTALQLAIENGFVDVEMCLREPKTCQHQK